MTLMTWNSNLINLINVDGLIHLFTSINPHSQSLSTPFFRALITQNQRFQTNSELTQHIQNLPPKERYNFRNTPPAVIDRRGERPFSPRVRPWHFQCAALLRLLPFIYPSFPWSNARTSHKCYVLIDKIASNASALEIRVTFSFIHQGLLKISYHMCLSAYPVFQWWWWSLTA